MSRPQDWPGQDTGQNLAIAFSKISLALRHQAWQQGHSQDLTPTQGQVLAFLKSHPGSSLQTLASNLGVRPPTASEAVTALVSKGWVRKERNLEDRRSLDLFLTAEGDKRADDVSLWPDFLAQAIHHLPEDEARVLMRALQRLIRHLQEKGEISPARMCSTCQYFQPNRHDGQAEPHHCAFVNASFGDSDLRLDCGDHQTATGSQIQRNFLAWTPETHP